MNIQIGEETETPPKSSEEAKYISEVLEEIVISSCTPNNVQISSCEPNNATTSSCEFNNIRISSCKSAEVSCSNEFSYKNLAQATLSMPIGRIDKSVRKRAKFYKKKSKTVAFNFDEKN